MCGIYGITEKNYGFINQYIETCKHRGPNGQGIWNDDNVTRLRDLWDQGLPTAQIGKLLGFTKNAVVGKAHRIGLERRPSAIR